MPLPLAFLLLLLLQQHNHFWPLLRNIKHGFITELCTNQTSVSSSTMSSVVPHVSTAQLPCLLTFSDSILYDHCFPTPLFKEHVPFKFNVDFCSSPLPNCESHKDRDVIYSVPPVPKLGLEYNRYSKPLFWARGQQGHLAGRDTCCQAC